MGKADGRVLEPSACQPHGDILPVKGKVASESHASLARGGRPYHCGDIKRSENRGKREGKKGRKMRERNSLFFRFLLVLGPLVSDSPYFPGREVARLPQEESSEGHA